MKQSADDLKEWMDARGLSAAQVAKDLGTEEQTVRKWRSQGVPDRRRPHIERYMAEWADSAAPAPDISAEQVAKFQREHQNLVLKPTEEQFETWDRASRRAGAETLQQWALEGLSKLAAAEPHRLTAQHEGKATGTHG